MSVWQYFNCCWEIASLILFVCGLEEYWSWWLSHIHGRGLRKWWCNSKKNDVSALKVKYRGADKSLARPDWKKPIERSPFFVWRRVHCCLGDLVGRTTFWTVFEWLVKEFGRCSVFPSWSGQGFISTPIMFSVFTAAYEGNSEWVKWSPSVLYPCIGLLYQLVMIGVCKYRALAQC